MKATLKYTTKYVTEPAEVILTIPIDEAEAALGPIAALSPFVESIVESIRSVLSDKHVWIRYYEHAGFDPLDRCTRCGKIVKATASRVKAETCPGTPK